MRDLAELVEISERGKSLTEHAVLSIDHRTWRSPLHDVQNARHGDARLHRASMGRGLYPFEGTLGYEYYELDGPISVMQMQRRERGPDGKAYWKTWMVDDPLHVLAMRQRVNELPGGRILCAGMGLGLMVRSLVARRDVTQIDVVEIDRDVAELAAMKLLPQDDRIRVFIEDWNRYVRKPEAHEHDAILWDLAVGDTDEARGQLLSGAAVTTWHLPEIPFWQFGVRQQNVLTPR